MKKKCSIVSHQEKKLLLLYSHFLMAINAFLLGLWRAPLGRIRFDLVLNLLYDRFTSLYVCASLVCLVPTEVKRECQFPWNWCHSEL